MGRIKPIVVFEYDRLKIGDRGFTQYHMDALLRLNEQHKGNYLDGIAKGVKFKNYVGVIQVDDLVIEILPKVDRDSDESTWRNVLLKMLHATGRISAESTGFAQVRKQHLNLLEIYFLFFLHEVRKLQHAGLIKQYRKETKNVNHA